MKRENDKSKLLQEIEMIYKQIAEEERRLCEVFLTISLETIENDY